MALFDALKGSIERLTDMRVARASHILLKGFDEATVRQLRDLKDEIDNDPEAQARFQERIRGPWAKHYGSARA